MSLLPVTATSRVVPASCNDAGVSSPVKLQNLDRVNMEGQLLPMQQTSQPHAQQADELEWLSWYSLALDAPQ